MNAYINGCFVQGRDAVLHVSDLSMQRGYAVFDFLRTVNGTPLFVDEHLNRFAHSARAMNLPLTISTKALKQIIQELVHHSQLQEAGIRLMLTGGYSADTYHTAQPNLLITCNPVQTSTQEQFEKGIAVITYEHQRELPHIKSINYLMAVWLHPLLKEKQADDVLYHHNNRITEFPRANVFAVIDGVLATPAHNMLKGITRKFILEQSATFMKVAERAITTEELSHASEIFLTSTTKRVLPVVKLNEQIVGTGKAGPVAAKLWSMFQQMEQQHF